MSRLQSLFVSLLMVLKSRLHSILFVATLILTVFCGWVAMHYPNPRLANCDFVWFGPAGFWDCPKGSGQ